jgi:hypothetical protein
MPSLSDTRLNFSHFPAMESKFCIKVLDRYALLASGGMIMFSKSMSYIFQTLWFLWGTLLQPICTVQVEDDNETGGTMFVSSIKDLVTDGRALMDSVKQIYETVCTIGHQCGGDQSPGSL